MPVLNAAARELVASGAYGHVVTLGADGAPHVTLAWFDLDGDELVFATLHLGPDVDFPPMPDPPGGYVTRVTVERVRGVGPWTD